MNPTTGRIFNIQHFSIHDGPGIRTVVFFKGCPLRCTWCGNPESQVCSKQVAWNGKQCLRCAGCLQIPGLNCHFEDDTLYWDMKADVDAKLVSRTCPSQALHVIGEDKTAVEILDEVEKDSEFYYQSGGGLTVSGGEPLLQGTFLLAVLDEAKRRGIGRAIETTGYAPYPLFKSVCEKLDYLLIDVKTMKNDVHVKETGVSNQLILENIAAIRKELPELTIKVRTPVIPGVNDTEEDIVMIADFVKQLGPHTEYELLKYHKLGGPKYETLHRTYGMGDRDLSEERFLQLRQIQERRLHE